MLPHLFLVVFSCIVAATAAPRLQQHRPDRLQPSDAERQLKGLEDMAGYSSAGPGGGPGP